MPRLNRLYKGLRSWAYWQARRLLDEEFQRYLGGSRDRSRPAEDELLPLPSSPSAPPALSNPLEIIPPSQTPSPLLQTPSHPTRSPSSAFTDALTERIFPDTPPLSLDSSINSIPICPRGIPSPTNSTDSVEFLEEIPPPPP